MSRYIHTSTPPFPPISLLNVCTHTNYTCTHHQVPHFQYEYGENERLMQQRFGPATAQMLYFARILRENYPSPSTYRIFVDRRWILFLPSSSQNDYMMCQ